MRDELAAYYLAVGDLMLPHLRERPVTLVSAASGRGEPPVWHRHAVQPAWPDIASLPATLDAAQPPLLEVRSAAGLQSAAARGVVELRTWNATVRSFQKPDRIVLDLDPGEGVAWPALCESAFELHSFLSAMRLKHFVKTSGGRGLHVLVPLMPSRSREFVQGFAEALARRMASLAPERFVVVGGAETGPTAAAERPEDAGPALIANKTAIDLRANAWGATTACAWSARARPALGISVPVGWDELRDLTGGAHWTVHNGASRIAVGNRPWESYAASLQGLASAIKALGAGALPRESKE